MADATRLSDLVAQRTGISLSPHAHTRQQLERFAQRRMKALRIARLTEYVELLSRPESSNEFARLMATLTNPQTSFFRDPKQFLAIRNLLLKIGGSRAHTLNIWCAGCATGEEPYSIAMLCRTASLRTRILATDLNIEALALAREGRYHTWSLRQVPPEHAQDFEHAGNDHVVRPELRQLVEFRHHNLVGQPPPAPDDHGGSWDIVLCRNVFIYFDREAIEQAVLKIAAVLAPGGWLFLSAAESLHGLNVPLDLDECEGNYGYRTRVAPPLHSSPRNAAPPAPASHRYPQVAPLSMPPPGPRWRTLLRSTEEVLADPDAAYAQATSLMDMDEFERAKTILLKIVGAYPERIVARLTLGNLLLRTHAFNEALEAYDAAHDIDPLLPETHYFQGLLFRKLGEHERAINAFRRAVFLEPSFWSASFLLAGTYARLSKWEPCRRYLLHTLEHLEGTARDKLFSSHTHKMDDANLRRDEVSSLCRRQLDLMRE